jgi:chemotaxis protein methyltransferase CheR
MNNNDCIAFLQWCLPRLGLRWPGYRKVRRQVCKRIVRRYRALGLAGIAVYRRYLETHPREWPALDACCRITISRFYRDTQIFKAVGDHVLPSLARSARGRGDQSVRCWSVGCASGEEPYSLAVLWALGPAEIAPDLAFSVIATDSDPKMLDRARAARYGAGGLRDIPDHWRDTAFLSEKDEYVVRRPFRACVDFRLQDIRTEAPDETFDLILCRNLAFTYFDEAVQRRTLECLTRRLHSDGILVIGRRESLPAPSELEPYFGVPGIYRKSETPNFRVT